MSISGFNGFNQLIATLNAFLYHKKNSSGPSGKNNQESIKYTDISVQSLSLIDFDISNCFLNCGECFVIISWSYNVICAGNTLMICGHLEGKNGGISEVQSPNNIKINQVSCSRKFIFCVLEDGSLWQYSLRNREWRDLGAILNTDGSSEPQGRCQVVKVTCGETLTAVLTKSGEVYSLPSRLTIPTGLEVADVACGRAHMLIRTSNGQVFTFGEGSRGQQGHGSLDSELEPRLLEGLAGLPVLAVACGGWHSCAVTTTGDLYTWGWNVNGQLGLKSTDGESSTVNVQASPLPVDFPDENAQVVQVACGSQHTVVVLDNGTVWGTGWNAYGQLGLSGGENVNHMTKIPASKPVVELICGPWSTLLRY